MWQKYWDAVIDLGSTMKTYEEIQYHLQCHLYYEHCVGRSGKKDNAEPVCHLPKFIIEILKNYHGALCADDEKDEKNERTNRYFIALGSCRYSITKLNEAIAEINAQSEGDPEQPALYKVENWEKIEGGFLHNHAAVDIQNGRNIPRYRAPSEVRKLHRENRKFLKIFTKYAKQARKNDAIPENISELRYRFR